MIPIALPALPSLASAAAWALGLKSTAARWLNKEAATALAVSLAVVVLVAGLAWGLHTLRADAAASADASWTARVADASRRAREEEITRRRQADDAAAIERMARLSDLDAARERIASLEQALAARSLKGASLASVPCVPADIARELNR